MPTASEYDKNKNALPMQPGAAGGPSSDQVADAEAVSVEKEQGETTPETDVTYPDDGPRDDDVLDGNFGE